MKISTYQRLEEFGKIFGRIQDFIDEVQGRETLKPREIANYTIKQMCLEDEVFFFERDEKTPQHYSILIDFAYNLLSDGKNIIDSKPEQPKLILGGGQEK